MNMAFDIAQVRHVGLFSPSLQEHARFYSDVWGLERVVEDDDAVFFRGTSPEYFLLSLHCTTSPMQCPTMLRYAARPSS